MNKNIDKQGLGRLGERIAGKYLQEKGYSIVDRNFRYRDGEVDIIAQKGDILIIVEVRARISSSNTQPEDSITYFKIKTLKRMADLYTLRHYFCGSVRIDAICIVFTSTLKIKRFDHYKDIEWEWG